MARRAWIVASAAVALVVGSAILAPSATETAIANGDTRTLHLFHTHTGESIDATFRVDGHYDSAVLRQLNHFLRDWRNNDEISMDPRLFDTLWEVYRTAGANQPIQIYSAYRSPETNAMLRRRSRAVAEHSQHMLGKAMDTTIPGFPMHLVREVGMRLQHGGVGWYPSANFVHLDVGSVRSWPRMPYDQLASLFPDGKTVHIASNGQVLPGYEAARQEIALRGDIEVPPSQESGGFFAWLFGGGNSSGAAKEDEEDRRTAVAAAQPAPQPVPERVAAPAPQPRLEETALAYAPEAAAPQPAAGRSPIEAEQLGSAQENARETAQGTAQPAGETRPADRQVASLESDLPDATGSALVFMPMPPRRPLDLATIETEIPLPPVRPVAVRPFIARIAADPRPLRPVVATLPAPHTGLDAIGGLITKTASGVPVLRRSRLPTIVTRGARTPGQALAFAPPDIVARDEIGEIGRADSSSEVAASRQVGLRAAARHVVPLSASAASSATGAIANGEPATMVVAPRVVGLRKAARLLAEKASL